MSVPFAAIVTPDSIVFTDPTGKTHTVSSDHTHFEQIKNLVREIGKNPQYPELFMDDLLELVTPAKMIIDRGEGKVTVEDGVVYYGNTPVHSTLTERILWGLREGFSMDPYIAFMENLMRNPSKRSVDQLFVFVERNKMGITEDGYILAYKRVRDDFKDIYSGKFDNSPGQIPYMIRNQVNDDPDVKCSQGLHVCAQSYLPSYGSYEGNKIVIVKVDPADVVSVPVDYNAGKMRCCRYEVLAEYEGSDKEDLLASKAVFNTDDFGDNPSEGARDCWGEEYGNDEDEDEDFNDDHEDSAEEFQIGDRIICIDDSDLGQTDIHKGGVYTVDEYDSDTREIYIGVGQNIGRYYDSSRFELWFENSESDDYDRGYDYGFKKGAEKVDVGIKPDGTPKYIKGFSDGWHDGFKSVTEQPETSEDISSPSGSNIVPLGPERDIRVVSASQTPMNVSPNIGIRFDPISGKFRPI